MHNIERKSPCLYKSIKNAFRRCALFLGCLTYNEKQVNKTIGKQKLKLREREQEVSLFIAEQSKKLKQTDNRSFEM